MATMTLMWVQQNAATGITYVDVVMSLLSLECTTMVADHPLPALENRMDSDLMWSTLVVCALP